MIPDKVLDLTEGWWIYFAHFGKNTRWSVGSHWGRMDIFCSNAAPGDAEYGQEMRNSSKGSFHKIIVRWACIWSNPSPHTSTVNCCFEFPIRRENVIFSGRPHRPFLISPQIFASKIWPQNFHQNLHFEFWVWAKKNVFFCENLLHWIQFKCSVVHWVQHSFVQWNIQFTVVLGGRVKYTSVQGPLCRTLSSDLWSQHRISVSLLPESNRWILSLLSGTMWLEGRDACEEWLSIYIFDFPWN